MALIQCPNCNKDISNKATKCPQCGYKLKKGSGKTSIKLIIVTCVLLISVIGIYYGYNNIYIPMKYYEKAELYLKQQKYEKAIKEFKNAGNYKDSSEQIKEAKYKWAENSSVDKSIELYEELGNYKDSKNKLEESKQEKEKQDALSKLEIATNKCCSYGTTLSSDKKSITVDSINKFDLDSMLDIDTIINELGLPNSLYDEMCYTNALMGRQTETYEYYEVSWSYHPDNGLDVIFKYIE